MERFIPHMHTCEIKLCKPKSWAEYCPLQGNLTKSKDECELCVHYVTIDFDPDHPLRMIGIVRETNPRIQ